jgi:hypothetical protein
MLHNESEYSKITRSMDRDVFREIFRRVLKAQFQRTDSDKVRGLIGRKMSETLMF